MGGGDDSLFSDGPDRVDLGAGKDYAFFYGPATLDRAMLIEGGPGADTLHGSSGSERMRGGGGDDLIEGRGGDDDFDVRGGGQDDVVCDPDAARPRGTVRLDVRDGVSGCGTILRTGTARPLFVVADRDVVTLECPPDQRRGCRGTIRVESGGRTVQRRRFAMRPDRLTDVIVRRRPLPRGRYRLTITTRNAIGRPVVIRRRFTVAARRP